MHFFLHLRIIDINPATDFRWLRERHLLTEVEARETRSNVGNQTSALGSWNGEEDVDSDFKFG